MRRFRSLVAGVTMVLLLATATLTSAGQVSAEPLKPAPTPASGSTTLRATPTHCSNHAHSDKDTRTGLFFDASAVNIRLYPHVAACAVVVGQGQLNHTVDYHCFGAGDPVTRNGVTYFTWTYLKNVTTGVLGWVSDAYLDVNPGGGRGSLQPC